jgi:hypothetical protein
MAQLIGAAAGCPVDWCCRLPLPGSTCRLLHTRWMKIAHSTSEESPRQWRYPLCRPPAAMSNHHHQQSTRPQHYTSGSCDFLTFGIWQKTRNRAKWSSWEDNVVMKWVQQHGAKQWSRLARTMLMTRTGKQCRERYPALDCIRASECNQPRIDAQQTTHTDCCVGAAC